MKSSIEILPLAREFILQAISNIGKDLYPIDYTLQQRVWNYKGIVIRDVDLVWMADYAGDSCKGIKDKYGNNSDLSLTYRCVLVWKSKEIVPRYSYKIPRVKEEKTFFFLSDPKDEWVHDESNDVYVPGKGLPIYSKELRFIALDVDYVERLFKTFVRGEWKSSEFVNVIVSYWNGRIKDNRDIYKFFAHLTLPFNKSLEQMKPDEMFNITENALEVGTTLVNMFSRRWNKKVTGASIKFYRNQMTQDALTTLGWTGTTIGLGKVKGAMIPGAEAKAKAVVEKMYIRPKLDKVTFEYTPDLTVFYTSLTKTNWEKLKLEDRKKIINLCSSPEEVARFKRIKQKFLLAAELSKQEYYEDLGKEFIDEGTKRHTEHVQEVLAYKEEQRQKQKEYERKQKDKGADVVIDVKAVKIVEPNGIPEKAKSQKKVFSDKKIQRGKRRVNVPYVEDGKKGNYNVARQQRLDKYEVSQLVDEQNEIRKEQKDKEQQAHGQASDPNDKVDKQSSQQVLKVEELEQLMNSFESQQNKVSAEEQKEQNDGIKETQDVNVKMVDNNEQQSKQMTVVDSKDIEKFVAQPKSKGKKKNKITFHIYEEDKSMKLDDVKQEEDLALVHTKDEILNFATMRARGDKQLLQQIEQNKDRSIWLKMMDGKMTCEKYFKRIKPEIRDIVNDGSQQTTDDIQEQGLSIDEILNHAQGVKVDFIELDKEQREIMNSKRKRANKKKGLSGKIKREKEKEEKDKKEQERFEQAKLKFTEQMNGGEVDKEQPVLRVSPGKFVIPLKGGFNVEYDVALGDKTLDDYINDYYNHHMEEYEMSRLKNTRKSFKKFKEYGISDEALKLLKESTLDMQFGAQQDRNVSQQARNNRKNNPVYQKASWSKTKYRSNFYTGSGNVPESELDVGMQIMRLKVQPYWWHGVNQIWFNTPGTSEKNLSKMVKQIKTIVVGSNMPRVDLNAPEKYIYTPIKRPDSTVERIDWTDMRMTLYKAMLEVDQTDRYIVPEWQVVEIKFSCQYSKEFVADLCIATKDLPITGKIVNSRPLYLHEDEDEEEPVAFEYTMQIQCPNISTETKLNEDQLSMLSYTPDYKNTNFATNGFAVHQLGVSKYASTNYLELSQQQIDNFTRDVIDTMRTNRIYTGSLVGQLARYSKCYKLKGSTVAMNNETLKLIVNNRFVPCEVNFEVLDTYFNLLSASLSSSAGEIQTKSSCGLLYKDQRKSMLTTLSDVIVALESLELETIPKTMFYYQMKPKFELQSTYAMYSNTRTIFVANSCSQVLSNLLFSGIYDVYHPDNLIMSDSDVNAFCEPNLLGINQQTYLKQILLNEDKLKDKVIIGCYSDNVYTLVYGKFTSYDGKKMESQIKREYIQAVVDSIFEHYVQEVKAPVTFILSTVNIYKKKLVVTKTKKNKQETRKEVDGYFVPVKDIVRVAPDFRLPPMLAELDSDSAFMAMLHAYLKSSNAQVINIDGEPCLNLNSVFKKVDMSVLQADDEQYAKLTISFYGYVPDIFVKYGKQWLPEIFEKGIGVLGTTLFPLGFLPSGWRATSLLNTVLSMTLIEDFYKLRDAQAISRGFDTFDSKLCGNKYPQLRFTKEAVVKNVWKLEQGVNHFDFLGYDVVVEGDRRWIELRHESLFSGPFWYNPQNYKKGNEFLNWIYGFSRWVSALFNGAVMHPEFLNVFLRVVKEIQTRGVEETIQVIATILDPNVKEMVQSVIKTGVQMPKILQSAWYYCDVDCMTKQPPDFIEKAKALVKDIKISFGTPGQGIYSFEKEVQVLEKIEPDDSRRADRVAGSLVLFKDPIYGNSLTEEELKKWMLYLQHEDMLEALDATRMAAENPETYREIKQILYQLI